MNNPQQHYDSLIIGGGIIGLSLAWELARRGKTVVVLEREVIGRGTKAASSWAGAGILPPAPKVPTEDPYESLKSLSHHLHPEWAQRLRSDTQIDTGFRKCGGLYLATTIGEYATLLANESWWSEHEINFERLDTPSLLRYEPELREYCQHNDRPAWRLPEEYQIRNPEHLKALRVACERTGVEIHENALVSAIQFDGSIATGVSLEDDATFSAASICICGGAWSRNWLDEWDLPSGLMPIRGQMLLYKMDKPPFQHVINDGNRYLVPRDDGYLLAGSVEEEVGFAAETTESALQQIQAWAERTYPTLRTVPIVKRWAGLRPGSFDTLPYLGSVPGRENLFVAAGHFRSGLHLSCATAVCMADLMEQKTPPLDLRPFRIGRG